MKKVTIKELSRFGEILESWMEDSKDIEQEAKRIRDFNTAQSVFYSRWTMDMMMTLLQFAQKKIFQDVAEEEKDNILMRNSYLDYGLKLGFTPKEGKDVEFAEAAKEFYAANCYAGSFEEPEVPHDAEYEEALHARYVAWQNFLAVSEY